MKETVIPLIGFVSIELLKNLTDITAMVSQTVIAILTITYLILKIRNYVKTNSNKHI